MRIFLAGASGVVGQRLIPRLVQAGHVVGGLTRSPSKTQLLSQLGAEPILCDVFDRLFNLSFSTTPRPDYEPWGILAKRVEKLNVEEYFFGLMFLVSGSVVTKY
jgi:nucleoside-diphosphate-sugar epimerase